MKWNELFDAERIPFIEDVREYIGEAKPIWDELVLYIEETYKAKQHLDYSKCSAQPGWNVKYKKSSKTLFTLYPMPNYFIALVVVVAKEECVVELAMQAGVFLEYVKDLYQKTTFSAMGRWLMIDVKDIEVLGDIRNLIKIRMPTR